MHPTTRLLNSVSVIHGKRPSILLTHTDVLPLSVLSLVIHLSAGLLS